MFEFSPFPFRQVYRLFVIKFKCPDSGRKYHTHKSYCYIIDDLFRTQILHKSLDNIFYMIQSTYFSPVFWNCLRFKRGPNFQGWSGKPILQNNWITWIEVAWFLGRNQLSRTAELFAPPFCISILKLSRTQNLCHSLDFNASCIIQEYLSQAFGISTN